MKSKLLFLLLLILSLASCNSSEDSKISTDFLQSNYSEEFHELNLAGQELTQVPNFEKYLTWSYIDNVWSIDLSQNDIEKVNWDLFNYFPNLKELNLSYNKIKEVSLNHNFLQDVKLHKNMLTNADLSWLKKLNAVNLGYNELKTWNDIKLPNSVKTLELQHNKLEDLSWIPKLNNLSKLKVEFNNLENEDMIELKDLKMLKFISAKFNKLSKNLEDKFMKFNEKNK